VDWHQYLYINSRISPYLSRQSTINNGVRLNSSNNKQLNARNENNKHSGVKTEEDEANDLCGMITNKLRSVNTEFIFSQVQGFLHFLDICKFFCNELLLLCVIE